MRPQDVALAAELGAWAVGFVFAPSRRRVEADTARRLVAAARAAARGRGPLAVGVFGDASPEAIVEVVDSVGLDAVQLHGSRPDAGALRQALGDREDRVLVIQAVPISATSVSVAELRDAVAAARQAADFLLFDTQTNGRSGGTGRTFPWDMARRAMNEARVAGDPAYLVAGGIGPGNVTEALRTSGAWGVDVSSGVERAPGVKDEALLRSLFASIAAASPGPAVGSRADTAPSAAGVPHAASPGLAVGPTPGENHD